MGKEVDARDGSLRWQASITDMKEVAADEIIKKLYPGAVTIQVGGNLADELKNGNEWNLEPPAIDEMVADINAGAVNFRVDHSKLTTGVAGKMLTAKRVDTPQGIRIPYTAEITTANPDVAIPILKGYVKGVSMSADPKRVGCSVCGKEGWPFSCSCKGRHLSVKSLKMIECSVTPDPAYKDGRATLAPLSFTAAMDRMVASMSQGATSMTEDEETKRRTEELKAMAEKLGFEVKAKADPLAETKAALEARNKELEAMKAELEKLKAGQQQAPPPPSAPGKPGSAAPPTNAGQDKKEEELSLEAQMKQTPDECFKTAFNLMRKQAGYEPLTG